MDLTDGLRTRRSIRQFNETKKLSKADIEAVLEAAFRAQQTAVAFFSD